MQNRCERPCVRGNIHNLCSRRFRQIIFARKLMARIKRANQSFQRRIPRVLISKLRRDYNLALSDIIEELLPCTLRASRQVLTCYPGPIQSPPEIRRLLHDVDGVIHRLRVQFRHLRRIVGESYVEMLVRNDKNHPFLCTRQFGVDRPRRAATQEPDRTQGLAAPLRHRKRKLTFSKLFAPLTRNSLPPLASGDGQLNVAFCRKRREVPQTRPLFPSSRPAPSDKKWS